MEIFLVFNPYVYAYYIFIRTLLEDAYYEITLSFSDSRLSCSNYLTNLNPFIVCRLVWRPHSVKIKNVFVSCQHFSKMAENGLFRPKKCTDFVLDRLPRILLTQIFFLMVFWFSILNSLNVIFFSKFLLEF